MADCHGSCFLVTVRQFQYEHPSQQCAGQRLEEEEWTRRVFRVLTPTGYASVITAVAIEFDYPKVAALVAPEVGEHTHECVVTAL